MTVTTHEPITIEHLDFEEDRSCESRSCRLGNPRATHISIWHLPCGCYRPKLICDDCTKNFFEKMRSIFHRNWFCKVCGSSYRGLLSDMIEVRPL